MAETCDATWHGRVVAAMGSWQVALWLRGGWSCHRAVRTARHMHFRKTEQIMLKIRLNILVNHTDVCRFAHAVSASVARQAAGRPVMKECVLDSDSSCKAQSAARRATRQSVIIVVVPAVYMNYANYLDRKGAKVFHL
jgi:hypothetical protein